MQYSFVAFLDILGFAQLVETDTRQPAPGSLFLEKMKLALGGLSTPRDDYGLIQFSDSIIISCPFSRDVKDVQEFLTFVSTIQHSFLSYGILLRGGVALGYHFQDDKILYSQGLIDAYRLESERADGPRVLVSQDLIELVDPDGDADFPVLVDEDGEYFLDYLMGCDRNSVADLIEGSLSDKSMGERARRKWVWLGRYFRFCTDKALEGLPSMRSR